MKRILTAAVLASALALGGCANGSAQLGVGPASASISTSVDAGGVQVGSAVSTGINTGNMKAELMVTAAYNAETATAHALTFAANEGWIVGQAAIDADMYLTQALDIIHQAEASVAVGKEVSGQLGQAYGLIGKASAKIPTTHTVKG